MTRILILLWLLITSYWSIAQVDTSVVLEKIFISTNARSTEIGSHIINLETQSTIGSVAQLIEQSSNTYIKNYGPGSLSTLSIRGGSSGQSLVLWNGLPLHSPMLGLLDLSLIPNNITDQVTLTKGGSSAVWGSGAVSGVLSLNSKKKKDYTILNSTSVGNFGLISQDLSVNLHNTNWHSTTKYLHESADRDFEYEVSPTLPAIKQKNAKYHRNHLIQDLYYNPNLKNQFAAHIWLFKARTEIPPTTVQNESVAYQEDAAIRSILSYKHIEETSNIEAKIGYYNDHNDYYNTAQLTEAKNRFDTWFADINGEIDKGYHTLSLGTTVNYTQASSEGYGGTIDENKMGVFITYLYDKNKFRLKTAVRQEIIDNIRIPVTPSLAASYKALSWVNLNFKVSRDFRNPTLNDRNWKPGGNEELKPESGWSQEIGIGMHKKIGLFELRNTSTLFYRDIKDWILWSPGQNVPYWSAQNINNVISRGIEQEISLNYSQKDINLGINLGYNYISSTYQSALTLPKVEAGDQLLYTPKHSARAVISLNLHQYLIAYTQSYTGLTEGVNEIIPSYQVSDLKFGYKTKIKQSEILLNLRIINILDHQYYVVERRPLPGRNYNIGITFKY